MLNKNNEIKYELFSEVGLGRNCSFADSCNDTNTTCSSGKCVCMDGYIDDNADESGGSCIPSNYFIIILPTTLDFFSFIIGPDIFHIKITFVIFFRNFLMFSPHYLIDHSSFRMDSQC